MSYVIPVLLFYHLRHTGRLKKLLPAAGFISPKGQTSRLLPCRYDLRFQFRMLRQQEKYPLSVGFRLMSGQYIHKEGKEYQKYQITGKIFPYLLITFPLHI